MFFFVLFREVKRPDRGIYVPPARRMETNGVPAKRSSIWKKDLHPDYERQQKNSGKPIFCDFLNILCRKDGKFLNDLLLFGVGFQKTNLAEVQLSNELVPIVKLVIGIKKDLVITYYYF